MEVVIDANVVLAMLIKPGKPVELLFQEDLDVFAPGLIIREILGNQSLVLKKARITEQDFNRLLLILIQRIGFVEEEVFLVKRDEAKQISPDLKDVHYFALALYLECPIWSSEKKFRDQDRVKIYRTHELISLFIP